MKKFIEKIIVLALLLVAVDCTVGLACHYLKHHSKGGDTGRMIFIADEMKEEVLIFGSSRAIHHYDPRIVEDSLELACYNCGRDGNGIIFNYGLYRLFRDRYAPRMIVYDVEPSYDVLEEHNKEKYLAWLRYFYDRPGIDSIFWSVDATERWKMRSFMRQYNEKFVQLVSDWHRPLQQDIKGYRPGTGIIADEPAKASYIGNGIYFDSLKMTYFKRLVADCKARGTQLVFAASPYYWGGDSAVFAPVVELAHSEGIPFLYHCDDEGWLGNVDFFYDSVHMNGAGAEAYTKRIMKEIKPYL